MSGILRFDALEVARLIDHAMNAPQRQASWGERLQEGARRKGVDVDDVDFLDWPSLVESVEDDYDPGPALMFVHDQGIYVMSNGHPQMDENDPHRIAYADGFNPDVNSFDEWWEGARDIVGGDDFVEQLPIYSPQAGAAQKILKEGWATGTFDIEVSDEQLSYGFGLIEHA